VYKAFRLVLPYGYLNRIALIKHEELSHGLPPPGLAYRLCARNINKYSHSLLPYFLRCNPSTLSSSLYPYLLWCVEVEFCELRLLGLLGSSHTRVSAKFGLLSTLPVVSAHGPPTLGSGHGAQPSQRRCPSALVSLHRAPYCPSRSVPPRVPRPRPRSPEPPAPS
jgi:hypothetical protein